MPNLTTEDIVRRRMHGLYLTRSCRNIVDLSRHLLGLHCWFHRNVLFSTLIRGADITGWSTALTKTWLYRGTLHGVAYEDLPTLLSLHPFQGYHVCILSQSLLQQLADEVVSFMEDGVCSRSELRKIFIDKYEPTVVEQVFSSWGGIFVGLAQQGKVAFQDMTSRDFELIDAEPTQTKEEVLPELLHRFFTAYGPATLDDAAWFFGLNKEDKKALKAFPVDEYQQYDYNGHTYYDISETTELADIPELTLLSGFDPIVVSYADRSVILPDEYKKRVVLSSGICLPTIAVNGKIAGLWNIKKGQPVIEFFTPQPERILSAAKEQVDAICWRTGASITSEVYKRTANKR
jgi:hypothetical protein